jgi:Leucine-rich repeat (LRR) protein
VEFIKALSYHTNLEMLSLSRNDMYDNYFYGFNFELLTNLTHLEFSHNRIANTGMKAISSLIKLKTLIMDRCRIDDIYIYILKNIYISKLTSFNLSTIIWKSYTRLRGNETNHIIKSYTFRSFFEQNIQFI